MRRISNDKRKIKPRNPMAEELRSTGQYRQRVVTDKKKKKNKKKCRGKVDY